MSRFRVVLVSPPPIAVVEPWYDTPDFGRPALATLAAYLRQDNDIEVSLIDAKLERISFAETLRRIEAARPDVVGLTAFTNEIKPSAYVASVIKERLPHVRTVVGGAHVTAIPELTIDEFQSFDIGVASEGEATFLELCQRLIRQQDYADVAGLVYRDGSQVIRTPARRRILNQDELPIPAWELLPKADLYWVQSERGCPFNCHFCFNPSGRVVRKRGVDRVIEEIEYILDRFQPRDMRFGDEIFTVDMERTHQLMDAMIEHGIHRRITWDCQTHVRFVDYELLSKMKAAGCIRIDMGIETGDEGRLRALGKGTKVADVVKAGDACRRAGLPFGTFLIVGQPDETRETLAQTERIAIQLNPNIPIVGVMTPYPGTEVSRMAAAGEGGFRLLTTDWDEYNKQTGSVLAFEHFTARQMQWLQILMVFKVFWHNRRYWDFAKLVWTFRGGVINVLRKLLFRHSPLKNSKLRPADYDARLENRKQAEPADLIRARANWEQYQKTEMQFAREEAPQLLKVVPVSSQPT